MLALAAQILNYNDTEKLGKFLHKDGMQIPEENAINKTPKIPVVKSKKIIVWLGSLITTTAELDGLRTTGPGEAP